MILGIGTDIVKNSRFDKWLSDEKLINRFFNEKELAECYTKGEKTKLTTEFLASRFAAKEAFAKALGCGFRNIVLKDIYVISDSLGKPILHFEGSVLKLLQQRNNPSVLLTMSHEKDFSVAFVVLESKE